MTQDPEKIRIAGVDDLPAIVALLADDTLGATRESAGPLDPGYHKAFAAITADPNQDLVVMEEVTEGGARIVACLQLTVIPGISHKGMRRGQVESVRVAADLRGQGLGHKLMQWAIAECRRRGCGMVQLSTNLSRLDAHRFYKTLGFEHSHAGMKLKL